MFTVKIKEGINLSLFVKKKVIIEVSCIPYLLLYLFTITIISIV